MASVVGREEGTFHAKDGHRLWHERWRSAATHATCVTVVFLHGMECARCRYSQNKEVDMVNTRRPTILEGTFRQQAISVSGRKETATAVMF